MHAHRDMTFYDAISRQFLTCNNCKIKKNNDKIKHAIFIYYLKGMILGEVIFPLQMTF